MKPLSTTSLTICASLFSHLAFAEIELVKTPSFKLELYGQANPYVAYDSDVSANESRWSLQDDASRIGLYGRYKINRHSDNPFRLYGRVELGNNFDNDENPALYTRALHLGIRQQDWRLQFGQQDAVHKTLDRYDYSNVLGGRAIYDTDAFATKRPENTLYGRFDHQAFRIELQHSFSEHLDSDAVLHAGSSNFRLNSNEMQHASAINLSYQPLDAWRSTLNYHYASYDAQGELNIWGLNSEYRSDWRDWRIAATVNNYQLQQGAQQGEVLSLGLGSRITLWPKSSAYLVFDGRFGEQTLADGQELSYTLGGQYQFTPALKAFAEGRYQDFDALKENQYSFATGINYFF